MSWVRKLHLWASVLVGLQVFIWVGTGFYFTLMDHEKSSGREYSRVIEIETQIEPTKLLEPAAFLKEYPPAMAMRLNVLLDTPVYILTHKMGLYQHFLKESSIVDAYSGAPIFIDKTWANRIAMASYSGDGNIESTILLRDGIDDFPKQQNVSWQVNFNDPLKTSVYIEKETGRLIGHSNEDKRFADFIFMLHFMDYANEGSFNNLLIMFFAFITLWLSFTGFIWTVELSLKGQYTFNWLKKS